MKTTHDRRSTPHLDANASSNRLVHLFDATLRFTSESVADAVVAADDREGVYLGSGDGIATGARLSGTLRWSMYSGNCLYPLIRQGQPVPDNHHLCTLNPGGFIDCDDGACIGFDGKGYGLRSPESYRISMTLAFSAEDSRYLWLTRVLGIMEGDFDEKAGRATWRVYLPRKAGAQ